MRGESATPASITSAPASVATTPIPRLVLDPGEVGEEREPGEAEHEGHARQREGCPCRQRAAQRQREQGQCGDQEDRADLERHVGRLLGEQRDHPDVPGGRIGAPGRVPRQEAAHDREHGAGDRQPDRDPRRLPDRVRGGRGRHRERSGLGRLARDEQARVDPALPAVARPHVRPARGLLGDLDREERVEGAVGLTLGIRLRPPVDPARRDVVRGRERQRGLGGVRCGLGGVRCGLGAPRPRSTGPSRSRRVSTKPPLAKRLPGASRCGCPSAWQCSPRGRWWR